MSTSIEWTDETWNPLRGCRRISPGCEHCYAERQAARPILSGPGLPYEGLVQFGRQGPRWTGALRRRPPR
jgi:protein gp37